MSVLPRVTETARERVAREYDVRGPDVCMAEVVDHLQQQNPEMLDMALKCAADSENPEKAMVGFTLFYRLLSGQLPAGSGARTLTLLPRVSPNTRELLVRQVDAEGPETFTTEAIAELDDTNPELLQMAHIFASQFSSYLVVMQGFALLYKSLLIQSKIDLVQLH